MARRRSSGMVARWAEQQRQAQRQQEEQQRRAYQRQLDYERAQRAATRAAARDERERRRLWDDERDYEALARTTLIETKVRELAGLLDVARHAPAPTPQRLKETPKIPPFNPGHLGQPIVMPDQRAYQVPPPTGLRSLTPSARAEHEAHVAQARAAFERDWHGAQQAEAARVKALYDYHEQFSAWADREKHRVIRQNAAVDDLAGRFTAGEPAAVAEYLTAMLYTSSWPDGFPRHVEASFDPAAAQLALTWALPGPDAIPPVSRVRYVRSSQREIEHARPAGEIRQLYRELLARSALRVFVELFRADPYGHVRSIALNGFVTGPDPATGLPVNRCLLACVADRAAFTAINLAGVDPVRCIEALPGRVSSKPDLLADVPHVRLPETGRAARFEDDDDVDLTTMDPIDFEDLVADLFRAMGMDVMTTARTGDGGVDVLATDPDPVRGGRIVIQVKRYAATVNPSAVRDLYGTVQHQGANKGILVTTSGFGPGSREFADGKPLTLIDGRQLVDLLHAYGLQGHLG